ncbi:dTDP-4-dehydrorhamnose 3,5-epimerase [Elizabethkingia sp. JS20170427COW]|uniref:dTDP-4-dehydrorhamnose 3,5-epimerase n=1 Tax=Elizabethkingia sp. JS20170427COW TaxID=2583851 RepID=UPI001110AD77|nr:dTDP-4-dehydrorhamnose 3,5-epimerase [Elizabethkingia sp. JS20170427COW]QCX52775.1 dTDP-4-dehydrorhamnose 3,5-epimerase [Elizabethkingia sp. JS20170427COW]
MKITETPLKDCFVIEPTVIGDSRGYFYEKFNQKIFEEHTQQNGNFVQDNVSKSHYGVLRGLHLQKGEHAQAKLVSCIEGTVYDVAVDLREGSPTYQQWFGIELSGENKKQLYIPRGFAHGFIVLSPIAIFSYKCDNFYCKESEGSVKYNDPDLNIDWKIPYKDMLLSEKDQNAPSFKEHNF